MQATGTPRLFVARTLAEAVDALAASEGNGAPFAGGTWIMRAPIRGQAHDRNYVSIGRIPDLGAVEVTDQEIRIGAGVTHAHLVSALSGVDGCRGLVTAAAQAANPAIRNVATVGGNICARDFPASDLLPALLALDVSVAFACGEKREITSIQDFIDHGRALPPGTLVTGITVARKDVRTAHARLPLRKAGDYPVAIVSMAVSFGAGGTIDDIRIAVGSVEASARRWYTLEMELRGHHAEAAYQLASRHRGAFKGRESIETPAWYRTEVLPPLTMRAMRAILDAGPMRQSG